MASPKKRRRPKSRLPYGLHLHLDARGYYVWRGVDPITGKRLKRSTGLRDIELATAKAKEFEDWLARRQAGLKDYSCWKIELLPLVDDWKADLRSAPPRRKVAAAALRRALAELGLQKAADLDDVGALDKRLKGLAAKGYRPSVLRRGFQDPLRRFAAWLAENGRHLDRNPLALWKPIQAPAKGKVRPPRRETEPQDFARVLLALPHVGRVHLRVPFIALLVTALREGALFDRDVSDFNGKLGRIDFGYGNDTKRRGAGALDSVTIAEIESYLGGRDTGPLFLSALGKRLAALRFRDAWRAAMSLALVDRFWPADEPRDLSLAIQVAATLLSGKVRVSKGGNPRCTSDETKKARIERAKRVSALAERLRETWSEHMAGRDVHSIRKTHRTWARSRGVLGEAIDAQLGHAAHEDAHTSAVLRAAAGSRTGRRHYLDLASSLFDPLTSAQAVRDILDEAMAALAKDETTMLIVREPPDPMAHNMATAARRTPPEAERPAIRRAVLVPCGTSG